jgi:hypothetical protein
MPSEVQILRVTLLALIGLAAPLSAQADVTVQERGTLSISNINVHTRSTRQIAGEKERTESDLRCQGTAALPCEKNQQIDIIRLDRGVIWKLEPKKRRYIETSFLTVEQAPSAVERSRAVVEKIKSCPQSQPTAVDISKCELSDPVASMEMTNDVGTFAGQAAKRTIFKLLQTCKDGAPNKACEVAYSFEVWLAPEDTAGLSERHVFQHRYLTLLGIDSDSGASPPEFGQYLAPYYTVMRRLLENSEQLKGFPLKTTFRLTFSGQPCGSMHPPPAGAGRPSAIAGASVAATQATSSSAQHAAGWGTADALERSTGSGVAGYVAGSAAGAFTGSLVSGLFAKKPKPEQPATSIASNSTNTTAATLLEFTLETVALSADPVPAEQFEPPPQFSKLLPSASSEPKLPSCLASAPSGALR